MSQPRASANRLRDLTTTPGMFIGEGDSTGEVGLASRIPGRTSWTFGRIGQSDLSDRKRRTRPTGSCSSLLPDPADPPSLTWNVALKLAGHDSCKDGVRTL